MTAPKIVCTLVAWLLLASSAPAQTLPLWKFQKGQVFEFERRASQKQTVEIKGKQFKQERSSTWHIRLDVKEKEADGFHIRAKLTKVEQKFVGGADADRIDPKLHEKMQGSEFSLRVTPTGRLAELRGYAEFLDRLASKDPARLKALRVTFPESALKEALADLFGPLPEREIAWQREYVEPIAHFGALRCTVKYKHEGTRKGRDRIDYTMQSKYELPKGETIVLFRIVKGDIKSETAQGTIAFDAAAGRLVEHERHMLLRGALTIEAMDRQQVLEFSSESVVKVRMKAGEWE